MSFSFGTSKSTSGFTIPTATTSSVLGSMSTPTLQFSTGSGDNAGGITPNKPLPLFGTSTSTGISGFSLGGSKPATNTASTLSFGLPTATMGTYAAPPATTLPQFGLGSNFSATPTSVVSTTTTAPTVNFGSISSLTSNLPTSGFGFGTQSTTAAAAPALNFNTPSTAPSLNFATATTAATTGATTFSLSSASSSAPSSTPLFGLSTSKPTTTTAASLSSLSFGFSGAPTSTSLSLTSTTTAGSSLTITPVTTQSSLPTTAGVMTFAQLEDAINKWTIDLEDQGKIFANQAKELNAWDHILISNGEKILALNSGIERVKQQQGQLDQELDFVLSQQKELEDLIVPLEKELAEIPIHDQDRNQIYHMAEDLDTQLKQMSEDLKEVIEHLNEASRSQDAQDPVIQISKILNAHMNSLQWIDRNTTEISNQLDELSKLQEANKRNLSFHNY